jgi:hypothetical protein
MLQVLRVQRTRVQCMHTHTLTHVRPNPKTPLQRRHPRGHGDGRPPADRRGHRTQGAWGDRPTVRPPPPAPLPWRFRICGPPIRQQAPVPPRPSSRLTPNPPPNNQPPQVGIVTLQTAREVAAEDGVPVTAIPIDDERVGAVVVTGAQVKEIKTEEEWDDILCKVRFGGMARWVRLWGGWGAGGQGGRG